MNKLPNHYVLISIFALTLFCGCGDNKQPKEPEINYTKLLYEKIAQLSEQGNTNGVIELISISLDQPEYNSIKPELVSRLIQLQLTAGRDDEARRTFLSTLKSDKTAAVNSFGLIYSFYRNSDNKEMRLEWTGILTESALPPDQAALAYEWKINTLFDTEQIEAIPAVALKCSEIFSEPVSVTIFAKALSHMQKAGNTDAAAAFLDSIEQLASDKTKYIDFIDRERMNLFSELKKWPEAEAYLLKYGARMADNQLSKTVSQLIYSLTTDKQMDTADRICRICIDQIHDKPSTMIIASRQWISIAKARGMTSQIPDRIIHLQARNLAANRLITLYSSSFYDVMQISDSVKQMLMMEIGSKLAASATQANNISDLKKLLIDGSFMMNDYQTALELLKDGVPDKNEYWHKMSICKISAHLALKEGRKEEAINQFKEFMEIIKNEKEHNLLDPSTGIQHSTEMTLGFNAKRIAGIYVSLGKTDEAENAYKEARDYYNTALENVGPNTRESDLIKAELSGIPEV